VRSPRRDDDALPRGERARLASDVEDERPADAGERLLLGRVRVRADKAAGADIEVSFEQLPVRVDAGAAEDPALPRDRVGDVPGGVVSAQAGSTSTDAADRFVGPW
jgi:hypothetical protein